MSEGHIERLLLADLDYQAALEFRAVAEEAVKLRERAVELHVAVGSMAPTKATRALARAQQEYKQLNRICLRHAARRLDASLRAEGTASEMESAVILFDITHPVAA
jgi:hypothetical protein